MSNYSDKASNPQADKSKINDLYLNPRYLMPAFRSQARNISASRRKSDCKAACLLEVIASHIKKHGHFCYASTNTLLNEYGAAASHYGVKPISKTAMYSLLTSLENKNLIERTSKFNEFTGQSLRYISININAVALVFSGAINWALKTVDNFLNRQKANSGRSSVDKCDKASNGAALEGRQEFKKRTQITKDLSKDRNKKKGGRFSLNDYLSKIFKKDADEMKSLQEAARDRRLTASGAKRIIKLYNDHGQPIAESFKRYLTAVIINGCLGHSRVTA